MPKECLFLFQKTKQKNIFILLFCLKEEGNSGNGNSGSSDAVAQSTVSIALLHEIHPFGILSNIWLLAFEGVLLESALELVFLVSFTRERKSVLISVDNVSLEDNAAVVILHMANFVVASSGFLRSYSVFPFAT